MKSIEERAKEYAPDPFDPDYILPAREGYIVNIQRRAYIAGVKEQKVIDIDKVCDWLRVRNVITKDTLIGFRKAIEEEE